MTQVKTFHRGTSSLGAFLKKLSAFSQGSKFRGQTSKSSLKRNAGRGRLSSFVGQPIGVSVCVLRKSLCCVCFTFLWCVPGDCGRSTAWLALQYCNPPPRRWINLVWLWHMHTGSVPQEYTHRRAATTELWSRSKGISCVRGATTGPLSAAGSYNPRSPSLSSKTDRWGGFTKSKPSGVLGVQTARWTGWQLISWLYLRHFSTFRKMHNMTTRSRFNMFVYQTSVELDLDDWVLIQSQVMNCLIKPWCEVNWTVMSRFIQLLLLLLSGVDWLTANG